MVSELVWNFLEKKQLLPPEPSPRGNLFCQFLLRQVPLLWVPATHSPHLIIIENASIPTLKFLCDPDKGQEHHSTLRSIELVMCCMKEHFPRRLKNHQENPKLVSPNLFAISLLVNENSLPTEVKSWETSPWLERRGREPVFFGQMSPVRPFTVQRGWWSLWMHPLRVSRAKQPVPGIGSLFGYLGPQQQHLFLPWEKSWSGLLPSWLGLAKSTNASQIPTCYQEVLSFSQGKCWQFSLAFL